MEELQDLTVYRNLHREEPSAQHLEATVFTWLFSGSTANTTFSLKRDTGVTVEGFHSTRNDGQAFTRLSLSKPFPTGMTLNHPQLRLLPTLYANSPFQGSLHHPAPPRPPGLAMVSTKFPTATPSGPPITPAQTGAPHLPRLELRLWFAERT